MKSDMKYIQTYENTTDELLIMEFEFLKSFYFSSTILQC